MLLSKEAEVTWNSKNKKHYIDLGYVYTRMNDKFHVKVEDLTRGSIALVKVQCDFCGAIKIVTYDKFIAGRKNSKLDACGKLDCLERKARKSTIDKYGTNNVFEIEEIAEKRRKTNLEKYEAENPFASKIIKEKIVETNLKKYGVKCALLLPEIKAKQENTCMERYGVKSYIDFLHDNKREKSPRWKGGKKITSRNRQDYNYKLWRESVFNRDNYTCKKCGDKSGNGHRVFLVGHHIKNWTGNEELRYDTENGITLCLKCHREFHKKYGLKNNNEKQIEEFIHNN